MRRRLRLPPRSVAGAPPSPQGQEAVYAPGVRSDPGRGWRPLERAVVRPAPAPAWPPQRPAVLPGSPRQKYAHSLGAFGAARREKLQRVSEGLGVAADGVGASGRGGLAQASERLQRWLH